MLFGMLEYLQMLKKLAKTIWKTVENKFSFLKEGLPSLKIACAHCMLGATPNLVIFYTALKPLHRQTSTIVIELVSKIQNSYLKRHLAPYTEGL